MLLNSRMSVSPRGRPIGPTRNDRLLDTVLSIWPNKNSELRFSEIHKKLMEKGVVQKKTYTYKTNRILKQLIDIGYIIKIEKGIYTLKNMILGDQTDCTFDVLASKLGNK